MGPIIASSLGIMVKPTAKERLKMKKQRPKQTASGQSQPRKHTRDVTANQPASARRVSNQIPAVILSSRDPLEEPGASTAVFSPIHTQVVGLA